MNEKNINSPSEGKSKEKKISDNGSGKLIKLDKS